MNQYPKHPAPAHLWRVWELAAEVVAAAGPVLTVAVVPLRPAAPPARLGVLWWQGRAQTMHSGWYSGAQDKWVGGWYSGGHAQQGGEASSCTVSNSRATILWPADSPTHGRPHTRSCNKPPTHPTAISSTAQPPPHTHTTANPAHPTYPRARVVGAARGVGVLVAVIPAAGGGGVNDAWIVAGPDAGGELLTHVAAAAAVGVAAGAVLVLACAAAAQGR